ncbi:MAG: hypothetical protein NTY19_20925 [Planctomycetota bacterium]|nr:hypothetical protein [Planctomycetota bacterium]
MSPREIDRRSFLQMAAATGSLGVLKEVTILAAEASAPVKIIEPVHGAVLNHRHGKQTNDGLTIHVSGEAALGDRVTVNGVACQREGTRFQAEVMLREMETDLVAAVENGGGRHEDRVRVVWDRYSEPRYRFSIDDNSFFLRDIAQKNYASLFDCFYLKMLRDLHQKYGVKFTVNIYYTTGDDFKLPQFPDRYKGQWRDNADWMKLAFHAYADKPDRPYQDVPPEKLIADLDLVAAEIHRFAGEEVYAPPTVIHFAMTRHTAFKPLFSRGVRALSGYFSTSPGVYDINYRWDALRSEYVYRHDAWKDFESGIVFSRVDIVCNSVPNDRIVGTLEPLARDANTAEIMDLFTHEQYFWPFYRNYIPDHPQRLDTAIRWVTEHGYKPVFLHEGFLGGRV